MTSDEFYESVLVAIGPSGRGTFYEGDMYLDGDSTRQQVEHFHEFESFVVEYLLGNGLAHLAHRSATSALYSSWLHWERKTLYSQSVEARK